LKENENDANNNGDDIKIDDILNESDDDTPPHIDTKLSGNDILQDNDDNLEILT
jgi:hypothetical protein